MGYVIYAAILVFCVLVLGKAIGAPPLIDRVPENQWFPQKLSVL